MDLRWNNIGRSQQGYSETCPIVILTTTNLTRLGLGSYLGLRGGNVAPDHHYAILRFAIPDV